MNNANTQSRGNEPDKLGCVEPNDFRSTEPFTFENGATIPGFTLRYETYGELNSNRSNTILICHALSGDHHCAGHNSPDDRKPGWWDHLIGPAKPIDTNRFFVICSNCLGGCQGSTGPSSINPETGRPYSLGFPVLTIRDMVRAQKRLLENIGIEELYCVVGGSMGGMQVLQWAIEYPDTVKRILPLATSARQSVQAIAFNEVGRCAIVQDPDWNGGDYASGAGPNVGLAVARMMAHITYLSDKGLEAKFGRTKRSQEAAREIFDVEFEVESYLRYQGESFINRFDANTYLYFSKALDRFDLYGESGRLDQAFAPVKAQTLALGFTSDWLFPTDHNREIVHALLRTGKQATYAELDMDLGHDSFLVQSPALYDLLRSFLGA
jgi:homoserine O-acetyltransferase